MNWTQPALAGALSLLPVAADVLWQDDFREPLRYETWGPRAWTIADGRCAFRVGLTTARLVTTLPPLTEAQIEAEVSLAQRNGTQWTTAGLSLYMDPGNHWQLMLVEAPGAERRYFELIENLKGVHQAQSHAGTVRTRLEAEDTGGLASWDYGRRYRLNLSISPDRIEGTITDPESGEFWRRTFSFSRGVALKQGRPALLATGKIGSFHSLRVTGTPGPPGETLTLKPGRAGTLALLKDPENAVAPELARAFEAAGYGVTLVDWDELGPKRLPHGELDLLVLADARRLSLGARDEMLALLHGAGKVMAIGAPALSELSVRTPDGWREPADWSAAYAQRLERVPLVIAPDAWRRSAMAPEQPSQIEPDPDQGERCWKITTDLRGWDTFRAEIAGAFGPDRELLVFEAKGDENTPQMAIECVEQDGSRWLAGLDLGADWQTYVLRPRDFPYWKDSDARGRGGPGDRLRPEAMEIMAVGLAGSHAPKAKDGPHTYWVRGLSTAAAADMPDPDFTIPDIEALCPSYKLYPMNEIAHLRRSDSTPGAPALRWTRPGYSPVWRERGRGLNRGRSWRWVPIQDAFDAGGRKRGSLISLMIGDGSFPNAVWANVGVADPQDALDKSLLQMVVSAAERMTHGCFLLEGGAELFSYLPGESITLGARAVNTSDSERELTLAATVTDADGGTAFRQETQVTVPPGRARDASWEWRPRDFDPRGYVVTATLRESGEPVDRITHRVEALRSTPAGRDEFVRVEGSNFMLGEEKWFFKGINYRPSWVAGYPHLNLNARECYDPEITERDLAFLESIGINALSAVHALAPPDPDDRLAYRDQLDFLDRCDRHGIKCFFIVPHGRPYQGADVEKVKDYITRSGLKDHPAIMCWELAWEPITGPWDNGMDFMLDDWNAWVVERYGSIDNAVADWAFDPGRTDDGKLPIPTSQMCNTPGEWHRYVAALRRGFSDIISAKYRDVARPLREWDPQHLISFRGGACGIPSGHRFAHVHSVGVAKHMDFLNPEGYNLQTRGWAETTPPDDLRRGGLVTLYYRFISREKPVVWMEFGHTVNGYQQEWAPELVHISRTKLEHQRQEYENFYAMIIESGARGAAPWWLPGGFRLGEKSDFGIIEPDGTPRPACEVLRKYHPQFDDVVHRPPTRVMEVDFDARCADGWEIYSPQYLEAAEDGEVVALRSPGTDTDSATCPLTAVGGGECTGRNPPQFLNAEFNRIELKVGDEPWRAIGAGETIPAKRGAPVLCRASVGNIGEAKWLAPGDGEDAGRVFLGGRPDYGLQFRAPIAADTPFLADARVGQFTLVPAIEGEITLSFEMVSAGRAHFGERRTVVIAAAG